MGTEIIEQHPDFLWETYEKFREYRDRGTVALTREAELHTLLADLDFALSHAVNAVDEPDSQRGEYRELYLAQHFRWVALKAYDLNVWLTSQADATVDWTEHVEDDNDQGEAPSS